MKEFAFASSLRNTQPTMNGYLSSLVSSADIDVDKLFVSPKYIKVNSKVSCKSSFSKKLFLAQQLTPHGSPATNNTENPLWCLKFSQDGRFLAAGGKDGYITIYKLISSPLDRLDYEHQQLYPPKIIQRDSVRSRNSTINSDYEFTNLANNKNPKYIGNNLQVPNSFTAASVSSSIASSPDSGSFKSTNSSENVTSNNDATGPAKGYLKNLSPMKYHFHHHNKHHHFSPASDSFPASSNNNGKKLYAPVFHDTPYRQFKAHNSDILSMDWSKNNFLLTSSNDKTVKIWHLEKQAPLQTYVHPHIVSSVAWHTTDDRFFVTGCLDTKLRLFSVLENKVVRMVSLNAIVENNNSHNKRKQKKLKPPRVDEMISSVVFYPRGERIVAGTVNGTVAIFDTKSFKKILSFNISSFSDSSNNPHSFDGNHDSLNSMLRRKLFKHDNSSGSDLSPSSSSNSFDENNADNKATSFKISGLECFDVIQEPNLPLALSTQNENIDDADDNIDTRILISSNDSSIRLYSCSKRKMLMKFRGHQNNSSQLQALSNPGFSGNSISLTNLNSNGLNGGVKSSANNHAFVLLASEDDYLYFWNTNDSELLQKNLKKVLSSQQLNHPAEGSFFKSGNNGSDNLSSSSATVSSNNTTANRRFDARTNSNSSGHEKKLGIFNQIFSKQKHEGNNSMPITHTKRDSINKQDNEFNDQESDDKTISTPATSSSSVSNLKELNVNKPLVLNSTLPIESTDGIKNNNFSYIHAHNSRLTGAIFMPWRSKNLLYLSNDPIYDLNKVFLDIMKAVTSNVDHNGEQSNINSGNSIQMNTGIKHMNKKFSPSTIKIINDVNDTMRHLLLKFTNEDPEKIDKFTPLELLQYGLELLCNNEVLMAECLETTQKKFDMKTKDTILSLLNPLNFEIIVSCDVRGNIRVFRFDSGSDIRKVIQENLSYEMEGNFANNPESTGVLSNVSNSAIPMLSMRRNLSSNSATSLLLPTSNNGDPSDIRMGSEDLLRSGSLHRRMGKMMRRLTLSNHHGSSDSGSLTATLRETGNLVQNPRETGSFVLLLSCEAEKTRKMVAATAAPPRPTI